MKISVDQIAESPKTINFAERVEGLNEIYRKSPAPDFNFSEVLDVQLTYYRSGQDIVFQGTLAGEVEGNCSRCLKSYSFDLDTKFDFVLTPDPITTGLKARELSREDLGLSFYSTEELDLSPLIREQVLLALPTRPLCRDHCRGLCGSCGVDLNEESCNCAVVTSDPRMAVFRTLKVGH
jgi:uncharacterized protein